MQDENDTNNALDGVTEVLDISQLLETQVKQLGDKQVTVWKMFEQPNWETFFVFLDLFGSAVKGRPKFEVSMRSYIKENAREDLCKIVTPSDIAFCLTTLDNQWQVWREQVEADFHNRDIDQNVRPKFSTGKDKTSSNGSLALQEQYQKLLGWTYDTIDAVRREEGTWAAFEAALKDKMRLRSETWTWGKASGPKRSRKRKQDLEEQWGWI